MSDPCCLSLTFPKACLAQVARALGWAETDVMDRCCDDVYYPNCWALNVDEANYAWCDELDALAKAKVPFFGDHGSGGDYPAGVFYSQDGIVRSREITNSGDYFVSVDSEGRIDRADSRTLRQFIKGMAQMRTQLERGGLALPEET